MLYSWNESSDVVIVVPFLDDQTLIMVKQSRYPLHKTLLEFPAGHIKNEEDPKDTAVRELAEERGLRSAQDIALRRLTLLQQPDLEYRKVIDPEEVITWVDINGAEEEILATSWANDLEARACAKICNHLTHVASNKSIVIVCSDPSTIKVNASAACHVLFSIVDKMHVSESTAK
jgi:8-oxo-dGTP pyrophosphatase MutT (NUDIX family)